MASERQKLVKKLDKLFSMFIRRRDKGICITCGRQQDWKKCDAGHYIRRGKMQFRWNEQNVNCQCKKCNGWNEGEKQTYRRKLVEMYGEAVVDTMERDSNKNYSFPQSDMKILIIHYGRILSVMDGKEDAANIFTLHGDKN